MSSTNEKQFRQIQQTGGSWVIYMKDAFDELGWIKGDFVKVDIDKNNKQIVITKIE